VSTVSESRGGEERRGEWNGVCKAQDGMRGAGAILKDDVDDFTFFNNEKTNGRVRGSVDGHPAQDQLTQKTRSGIHESRLLSGQVLPDKLTWVCLALPGFAQVRETEKKSFGRINTRVKIGDPDSWDWKLTPLGRLGKPGKTQQVRNMTGIRDRGGRDRPMQTRVWVPKGRHEYRAVGRGKRGRQGKWGGISIHQIVRETSDEMCDLLGTGGGPCG